MNWIDRFVIFAALSAVVIVLVWEHNEAVVVGQDKADIPTDRINKSVKPTLLIAPGPSYLVSNLPVARAGDDALAIVADHFSGDGA
jgi:hypothetical protein